MGQAFEIPALPKTGEGRGILSCCVYAEKGWASLPAEEQDPDKLLELCAEIDRMLSEKEERLRNLPANKQGAA